jgi:hypothetical protein
MPGTYRATSQAVTREVGKLLLIAVQTCYATLMHPKDTRRSHQLVAVSLCP